MWVTPTRCILLIYKVRVYKGWSQRDLGGWALTHLTVIKEERMKTKKKKNKKREEEEIQRKTKEE